MYEIANYQSFFTKYNFFKSHLIPMIACFGCCVASCLLEFYCVLVHCEWGGGYAYQCIYWPVSVCVLVGLRSHFELHFFQRWIFLGSQTSVLDATCSCLFVLLFLIFCVVFSGPLIFQEMTKSDLCFSMVSETL